MRINEMHPRLRCASQGSVLQQVVWTICATIFSIGSLALTGWAFDIAHFKSVLPSQPLMMPLTAAVLVIASLSLLLLSPGSHRHLGVRYFAGRVCAVMVAVVGLLCLGEHLTGWNAIDGILFAGRLPSAAGLPIGRPSHYTSFILALLGMALLLLDRQTSSGHRPSQFLALIAGLTAALGLEGHIIDYPIFYRTSSGAGMALHTVVALLLLAGGVFLARPGGLLPILSSPDSGGQSARRLLPLPFLLSLALSWLGLAGGRAGFYDRFVGIWLLQLANLVVFTLLIWFNANKLHRADLERRAALDALQESEERFRKVFEDGPLGMAMVGLDCRFLTVNPALCRIVGRSGEELSRLTLADIVDPDCADAGARLTAFSLGHADSFQMETRCLKRNGEFAWIELHASVIRDPHGASVRVLALVEDISERKQSEQELNLRTIELEDANRELEAFSFSVSHDLRAPLRAINGFSRIILEECGAKMDSIHQRHLRRVCDGAQQMGQLIDDLLSFSRLSRQPLKKQRIELAGLVRQVIADLHADQNGRQVEISIADLPDCLGDPALLKQVFVNLISNAIKFTRRRELPRIEIGHRADGSEGIYFVKDNGAGFAMSDAAKLFEVFQRLHRADQYEGTGVGLAIVKRVVQRHGGRVWAESEPDQGAAFYFTLEGIA